MACSMAEASQFISQKINESRGQDVSPFPGFAPIQTLRHNKPFPHFVQSTLGLKRDSTFLTTKKSSPSIFHPHSPRVHFLHSCCHGSSRSRARHCSLFVLDVFQISLTYLAVSKPYHQKNVCVELSHPLNVW